MSRQQPLYNGQQRPAPQPDPVRTNDILAQAYEQGMTQMTRQLGAFFAKNAELETSRQQMEATARMQQIRAATQLDIEKRLQLPDGHEKSFFDKQGNLNTLAVQNLADDLDKQYSGIGETMFDPQMKMQVQARAGLEAMNLVDSLGETCLKVQRQKQESAFNDAFQMAVLNDDYIQAGSILDQAVLDGIIPQHKAALEKLKLARRGVRLAGEAGSVNIGGQEFSGYSAALAAQAARDGYSIPREDPEENDNASLYTAEKLQGRTRSLDDVGKERLVLPSGDDLSLDLARPANDEGALHLPGNKGEPIPFHKLDPLISWTERGDLGPTFARLSQLDVDAFNQDVWSPYEFAALPQPDGTFRFLSPSTSVAVIQRMAARADAQGGLTRNDALEAVAHVAIAEIQEDPDKSTADILNNLKNTPVFSVLGEGNDDHGREVARTIVDLWKRRRSNNNFEMDASTLKRRVEARADELIDRRAVGQDSEYMITTAAFSVLDPSSTDAWEKKDARKNGLEQNWFTAMETYRKYRDEFMMDVAGQKGITTAKKTGDEFAANAVRFYKWWTSHPGKEMRQALKEDVVNAYYARLQEGWLDTLPEGKEGKYTDDISRLNDVLYHQAPDKIFFSVTPTKFEDEANGNRKKYRELSQKDIQKWTAEQKKIDAAKAEQKKQDKKRAGEEEERKKKEEYQQALTLERARRKTRGATFYWDGKPAPPTQVPECTIPKKMYRELTEKLGYDGSQDVYLSFGGNRRALVTGTNDSAVPQLNAAAIHLVQGKLKKGQKAQYVFKLPYSYQFKNIINKL